MLKIHTLLVDFRATLALQKHKTRPNQTFDTPIFLSPIYPYSLIKKIKAQDQQNRKLVLSLEN